MATYTLTVEAGAYTLTGAAVSLKVSRKLPVAAGAFAVTGHPVRMLPVRASGSQAGTGEYHMIGDKYVLTVMRPG